MVYLIKVEHLDSGIYEYIIADNSQEMIDVSVAIKDLIVLKNQRIDVTIMSDIVCSAKRFISKIATKNSG